MKKILVLYFSMSVFALCALETFPGNREFQLKTTTLSVIVRDGLIVEVRDIKNGKLWADRRHGDTHIPCGLGILTDINEFRNLHQRCGWFDNGLAIKPGFTLFNYYRPNEKSTYILTHGPQKTTVSWKGLSNGRDFLPDAVLKIVFAESKDGALEIQASGTYPGGNVFGVISPVTNLDKKAWMLLPLYGGKICRDGKPAMLSVLSKNEDMEAPLMILEDGAHSLAFWMENPTLRPYHVFANRSGKSFAYIFENNTLMYFQDKKEALALPVFLNVFKGGWKTAATPYRDWYRTHFKKEIGVRDGVRWTRNVGTILNLEKWMLSNQELKLLQKFFPSGSLMIMTQNARAPGWDRELPDWTPREKYVDGVTRAHDHGFKTMAYVNICCANYRSPAWKQYKLDDFFMPQKVSIAYYLNPELSQEEKDNMMNFKVFEGFKEGNLYYGDLLSEGWRKFHAELMKKWNTVTHTDANYEDTAGCGLDAGNGIVDGLSASQGEMEQMRLLQETQPEVAISSEYTTPAIAFAVSWSLKLIGCWRFNDDIRETMLHDFRPLSTFLYGHRAWSSGSRGYNAHQWHIQSALSDSLGGLGFIHENYYKNKTKSEIDNDYSFEGHLHYRSKLFSTQKLLPYFPKEEYPQKVICMYEGRNGIFSYYDDGFLQEMRDPRGQPLYGRVNNAFRVKTTLWLENWPFQNGKEIFGLNPDGHYPLFPRPTNAKAPAVSAETLPDGVFVKKYLDTPDVTYLELDTVKNGPSEATLNLKSNRNFVFCIADGKKIEFGKMTVALPCRLICFTKEIAAEWNMQNALVVGGRSPGDCANGKKFTLKELLQKNNFACIKLRNATIVLPITVSSDKQALELVFQDRGDIYVYPYDGIRLRFCINGIEVKHFNSNLSEEKNWIYDAEARKKRFDLRARKWIIPLGKYVKQTILVTIEIDNRDSINGDNFCISTPRIINDPDQQQKEEILK